MKQNINWLITHDGTVTNEPFGNECLRCGAYHKIKLPISVDEFIKISKAFIALHKLCKESQ